MNDSRAHSALKHFFAVRRELEADYAAGRIEYVNYLVTRNHHLEKLNEQSHLAAVARSYALTCIRLFLEKALTDEQRKAAEELCKVDPAMYAKWHDTYIRTNIEATSYTMLDTLERLGVPDIPAPSAEAIAKHDAARNLQLEGRAARKNIRSAAKPINFAQHPLLHDGRVGSGAAQQTQKAAATSAVDQQAALHDLLAQGTLVNVGGAGGAG